MKIFIRKSAIKDLKKINSKDKEKLIQKINELKNFPNISNCKRLSNFQLSFRVRVGIYRILFDVLHDKIEIGRILHRKDSYKKKG